MIGLRILPAAQRELEEAARWYDERDAGLGEELLDEVEERLGTALAVPDAGALVGTTPGGAEIRRFMLRRFARYGLLIAVINGGPVLLAFVHTSRRPGYWRRRVRLI